MISDGAMAVNLTVGDLRALIRQELAALPRSEETVYLTLAEAAKLLKLSTKTVLKRVKEGLPGERLGHEWRFEKSKLVAFMKGGD